MGLAIGVSQYFLAIIIGIIVFAFLQLGRIKNTNENV
jgi:hypothetical protein